MLKEECAICGRPADFEAFVEGAKVWVCERDARYGRVMRPPQQATGSGSVALGGRGEHRPPSVDLVPDYAARITKARQSLELSREELAKTLFIRENELAHAEEGKIRPDEVMARKLKRFLKIQLVETDGGAPTDEKNAPPRDGAGKPPRSGNGFGAVTLGDMVEIKRRK